MTLHRYSTLVAFALAANLLLAQQVQWLTVAPNTWALNPGLPVNVLCAPDPAHVYAACLSDANYNYGNNIMGSNTLTRSGADGAVIWSTTVGDSVKMESIASDEDGNVILGGRYFQRLLIDGQPVLTAPAGHAGMCSFLCALDENRQLLWQRDVSGDAFEDVNVASLALDQQGRMWVALATFFGARIVRLQADGSEAESWPLVDSKSIGSISFDPFGGLYVSGGATQPSITVNGTSFPVNEAYVFFVARLNAAGDAQWLRTAHAATFQRPRVQADGTGHAYLLGSPYDSLSWGDLHFNGPEWISSFFLTRLDSLGVFDWGVQPPQDGFQGQFELSNGQGLGVDGNGNAYVYGTTYGTVDWGNGVVSTFGSLQDQAVTVLSLDSTGMARWQSQGGSDSFDVPHDLAVADDGIVHVVGTTGAAFTFGLFTVEPADERGSFVARIDPSVNTGISAAATSDEGLAALPSVFTSSFRLTTQKPMSGAVSIVVMDATGRVVEGAQHWNDELGLGLARGSYEVVMRVEGRVMRTRVVKE